MATRDDFKPAIRRRLAATRLEPGRAVEIAEELAQHLDDRYDELVAGGAPAEQAAAAALAELDGMDLAAAESSAPVPIVPGAVRGGSLAADLLADLRYGTRALRKSPGFAAVTILSLALGIGATTSIFQLLDALNLRHLPVPRAEELARVKVKDRHWGSGGFSGWHSDLSFPQFQAIRERQQAFGDLLAFGDDTFNTAPSGQARWVKGVLMTGNAFDVLGVHPALGRVFGPADDRPGCAPVTVLSHAYWQRAYGGDPGAVGKRVSVDGHDAEIVGVAQAGFQGLEIGRGFDLFMPLCMEATLRPEHPRLDSREQFWLSAMGRLKPAFTVARAAAHLDALSLAVADAAMPDYSPSEAAKFREYRLTVLPAAGGISQLRESYTTPLYFLLGTAALVLLITCANLANLLLARASVREREIAVRLALGASRGRLIRQLLTESLLVAVFGGALGLLLAGELSRFLLTFLSTRMDQVSLDLVTDWRIVGFTAGLAAGTCVLFGLAPALRATRTDIGLVLKATGGHGATGRLGLRRLLVVTQIALSFVLLVGALLFTRSFRNLVTTDPGFKLDGLVEGDLDLRPIDLPRERRVAFKEELLARVRAVPGVAAAGLTTSVPLTNSVWAENVGLAGGGVYPLNSYFSRVSAGTFAALGIPIVAGRDFDGRDVAGAPLVAVVTEELAAKLAPGRSPLGLRFADQASPGSPSLTFEIVGVVRSTRYRELREPPAKIVYLPSTQDTDLDAFTELLFRPAGTTPAVARALSELAPAMVMDFDLLETHVESNLLRERLMATLSGVFGLLAAVLVTIGLYGVIAYSVARRTHEIGIRMALGADQRRVSRMVLGEALGLLGVGLAAGCALALPAARVASSQLYGLTSWDPLTFGAAIVLLAVVALVASVLPARRAARVDPMEVLRDA